jgi:putrescine---pyruvate transaminase
LDFFKGAFMTQLDRPTLLEHDKHMLHPMYHPANHQDPLVVKSAQGVWLHTVDGRKMMDGLAGLWNVNVGFGRKELAEAAYQQMLQVAYCNNYAGMTNIAAAELAHKLSGYAYEGLNTTYFSSGGAESNESAFKTVRYYWKRLGKPNKVKVISRMESYHGVTLAAMSATGGARFWTMFEPRVPNFLHIPAPNSYRYAGDIKAGESVGQAAARALEEAILREGPDTVAAFIAEPIQGAGGLIIPPDDYFPRIREICSKYDVLFIADEVITGFGRTGSMFALHRYGVKPDIMSFAKGITSGYIPLGGIQISDAIKEVIDRAPVAEAWNHGYTYSGHATACAVALKNLEIMERENLAANAAALGKVLLEGLQKIRESFPQVDNARGIGLLAGIEFVKDRSSKEPDIDLCSKVWRAARERDLVIRNIGATMAFSPSLTITKDEVKWLLERLYDAIAAVTKEMVGTS